ncbi:MAG: hypothetical protein NUV34_02915 [Sulfuricaulis sp.]|nr:hypothetical protein [Sulfuricaulis sp.]
MTTKTEYSCNLCHTVLAGPSQGTGIQRADWMERNFKIVLMPINKADDHLCNSCVTALRKVLGSADGPPRPTSPPEHRMQG